MTRPQSITAPLKRKNIVDRLPSIPGWITECNVFRILSDACIEGFREHGHRIGVIRGPDFSTVDGGLVFDPPESFPMDMDPSAVWAWVHEHQHEHNMQIVPMDIKLTIHHRLAHQLAPIFIVAPPENTEVLCILPINSYTALHANWKLENTDGHNLVQAPFAVHRRHVFEALLSLQNAFRGQSPYVNPSNGVSLRGWEPPILEPSLETIMLVSGERQRQSARAVQQLAQVLRDRPDCQMELLFNLVQPLGCDLVLRDKVSSIAYLIEHKMTTPKKGKSSTVTLNLARSWGDITHNWHFLFHQQDHWLGIHTREGHERGDTTPAVRVDLWDPQAASIIGSTVRSYGGLAKQRLQTKWQTLDAYEDDLPGEESESMEPTTTEQKIAAHKQSVYPYRGAKEQLRVIFCDAMNDQCYKLGKHVCIILEGNACGDAVIIRHDWTQDDAARYAASKMLPLSLVDGEQSKSPNALVLRFLPHSWPPRVPPSEIFEPARTRTIEIPLCMGQPFIYVAATSLMHRILTILPPGKRPWAVDDIEATYNLKMGEIMKERNCKEKTAHGHTHKAIIGDDAYGLPLRDLVALFGFQTEYTLRCDHCKDEDSCRFYIPEIAYSKKMTPMCANCHGSIKVCTFHGIANSPDLVEAMRNFELFRRHVPCNQCYTDGQDCDNRVGICKRCETTGKECARETCKNRSEPGDDSHCPRDCDKAHDDDGYTGVSKEPRGKGCNARLLAQKYARAGKSVPVRKDESLA